MTLAAWLVAMVGPIAARLFTSLGLALVTMGGLSVAFDALKDKLVAAIGGLPAECIQLAGLFGIWEALGLILGAYLFVFTWASTKGVWAIAKA